jgi:hypothetical protein
MESLLEAVRKALGEKGEPRGPKKAKPATKKKDDEA